jgi:ABC-2 type transport system permease protein
MNTHSETVPESGYHAQTAIAAALRPTQPLYWSVRREIWENRSLYLAPLAAAGIYVLALIIGTSHLSQRMQDAMSMYSMQAHSDLERPYNFAALLMMGTTMIVSIFYCLDAFQSERRDRSILFWKSLPVSDLTTVLSKVSVPFVVLPAIAIGLTIAMQWIMLLVSSAVLMTHGISPAKLWVELSPPQMWAMVAYHMVTVHVLWYAPYYCWMLLVSAWARRAPFVWAILPLFVISLAEKIAFNTWHFAALLGNRLGGSGSATPGPAGDFPVDAMTHLTPFKFLGEPGLWIGLALSALFLAAAVKLRRERGASS